MQSSIYSILKRQLSFFKIQFFERKIAASSLPLALLLATFGATEATAQCEDPTVTRSDYCVEQPATIELEDGASNVRYKWFNDATIEHGSYGVEGTDGKQFISASKQTAPNSFYYSKEIEDFIGPTYASRIGGSGVDFDETYPYLMNFSNSEAFTLNSVNAVVRLDDPGLSYGVAVRYDNGTDSTYSEWYEFTASDLISIGSGFYLAEIATDLEIEAGTTNTIEIISGNEDYGTIDGFYWWASGYYPGESYFNGIIDIADPTIDVDGTELSPMIFEWKVTLRCARQEVQTTLGDACCTIVGDDISISASSLVTPTPSNPVTVTATGSDVLPGLYYGWYDATGTLIGGGLNVSSIEATTAGQFVLKAMYDPKDYKNPSCFTRRTINLGIQSIYAPEDFTVCLGEPITLRGEGAEGEYNWYSEDATANSYIVEHDVQTTDLYVMKPGEYNYTVEGQVKMGNAVEDGKFEFFNQADPVFNTSYSYVDKALNGGEYYIENTEIVAWGGGRLCEDPDYWTKTDPVTGDVVSRGNIYLANAIPNGSGTPKTIDFAKNNYLWKQTLNVEPNTKYFLSVDVSNWNPGATPPNIMVVIDDVALELTVKGGGGQFVANGGEGYYAFGDNIDCAWETLEAEWESNSNTSITMYISEVSNQEMGYEFAMDDITFYTGRGMQTDDVTVTVEDCNEFEARADGTACIGEAFDLNMVKNNGFFLDWTDSDGKIVSTDETAVAYPLSNETYTARAKFPLINFIKNSNLEEGRENFEHDFSHPAGNALNQGDYVVADGSSSLIHTTMITGIDDHSSTGDGLMLIARPKTDDDVVRKTIRTTAGEEYGFSFWMHHLHLVNANCREYAFDIIIDGTVSKTIKLPCGSGWTFYNFNWKAALSGTSEVELRFTTDYFETGIAIDDIILAQLGSELTDDVELAADLCNELSLDQACNTESVKEVYYETDGIFMGWYENDGTLISFDDTLRLPDLDEERTIVGKMGVSTSEINKNTGMEDATGLDLTGKLATDQIYPSNQYAFLTDASKLGGHSGFVALDDPSTPGGKYLVYDSEGGTDNVILKTVPLELEENIAYSFEISIAYLKDETFLATVPDLYPVRLAIDGVEVASFELDLNDSWQSITYSWVNETATNAVFELIADKTEVHEYQKVAYAMDDLFIKPVYEVLAEDILLEPCTPPCNKPASITITTPDPICEDDDVIVAAEYEDGGEALLNGSMTYVWYKKGETMGTQTELADGVLTIPDETISALTETTTYILRVEDGTTGKTKCYLEEEVEIKVDPKFTIDLGDPQNICAGETATIDAGKADAEYEWSNAETTQSIAVGDAGTYTVTVTAGACKAEGSTDIVVTPIPTVTLSPDGLQKICDGQTVDFTASVEETGNWEFVYYQNTSITQAQSATATYSTATAGEYYAVAISTDNEDCLAESDKVTVQLDGKPTVNLEADTTKVCDGTAELSVNVGSGNWEYEFFDENDNSVQSLSTSNTFTVSATGNYYAYAQSTDNAACFNNSDPIKIEIGETPVVALDEGASTLAYCEGGNGAVQVTELADVTYSWSNSGGAISGADGSLLSPALAETYNVEVTSGFCSTSVTDIVVEEKDKPTYEFSGTTLACEGETAPSVQLSLTGVGPWDIVYNNGTSDVSTTISSSPASLSPSVLTAGEYTFTMISIYDQGTECDGEITTSSATITIVKPEFTFNTIASECENGSNVDVSKSVIGDGTFAYSCTEGAFIDEATGEFDISASKSGIFNISVIMTDANECQSDALTQTLEVWEAPTAEISGDAYVCVGSTTEVNGNPAGGTTPYVKHLWTGDTGPLSATNDQTATFAPTNKGEYAITYTITDDNGCEGSNEYVITAIEIPTVSINTINDFCSTDNAVTLDETFATVSPAGGDYTWKIDGIDATQIDPSSLTSGNHTITLDYFNSCAAPTEESSFMVTFAELPTVVTNPVFSLTTALPHDDLVADGIGSEFRWYNEKTDPANDVAPVFKGKNFNPAHTLADIYQYYLTQIVNGCESQPVEAVIELSDCPTPEPEVTSYEICEGQTITALTATGSGTIKWYRDATKKDFITTGASFTPSTVESGLNIFYATQDNDDCEGPAAPASIMVNELPKLSFALQEEICQEANSIKLANIVSPVGGEFTMDNGNISSFDPSSFTDEDKTIEYSYTDNNKCSNSIEKTITVHATPSVTISGLATSYCASNPDVDLTFTGSTGGTATWTSTPSSAMSNNTFMPSAFTNIKETDISVSLDYTDEHGCVTDASTQTKVYGTVKITPSEDVPDACVNASSFDLSQYLPSEAVSGGTYNGPGILSGSSFDPAVAGTGSHTVTYSYTDPLISCPAKVEFDVAVKALPVVSFTPTEDLCINSPEIILSNYVSADKNMDFVEFSGYSVSSNPLGQSTFNPNIDPGDYVITAEYTDTDGCVNSKDATVTVHQFPTATISGDVKVCEFSQGVVYDAAMFDNGNNYTYEYEWTVTNEKVTFTDLDDQLFVNWSGAGFETISVKATDPFGCVGENELVVSVAKHPNAKIDWDMPNENAFDQIEYDLTFNNKTGQTNIIDGNNEQNISFETTWDFGESLNFETYEQAFELKDIPFVRTFPFGQHEVSIKVVNDHGCVDTASVDFFIKIEAGLHVGNTFAPDHLAPGVKDFKAVGFNLKDFEMWIYDEWGNVVWYTNQLVAGRPSESWDGTFEGTILPTGMYMWRIDASFLDDTDWEGREKKNGKQTHFGEVLLLR